MTTCKADTARTYSSREALEGSEDSGRMKPSISTDSPFLNAYDARVALPAYQV